jgi:hypothetical protein
MKFIWILVLASTISAIAYTQANDNSDQKITREATSMRKHATATFGLDSWDEKTFDEKEGMAKLSRVSTTKSYKGDIEGEGKLEYLMMYRADGTASFVGLERVTGTIGGRSGSFVLQHSGRFEGGMAKAMLSVVQGSGTGDLRGMTGEGEFNVGHQPPFTMTLDYDFE